jgi:TP901 family phage tail tape measure protein
MSSSAIRAGAAFVELGVRNKMERGLNAASKRLKSFSSGVSGAGMSMAGLGVKIATPFALAAGVFASFDGKMAAVKAITGSTDAQMERLRDTAKSLGASTQFSASQAADAMKFLGMAGYDTEEILAGIPAVLDLAAAGGLELAMAADIASDVSSAFGLAADQIGRVADVMAATATSSNTSVEMMGETFKYLAPLAAAAGQSIEQAAAVVANSGVKASMAGTDLALMMKTLADPAAQKTLKGMGVETVDAAGNVRDFTDIIRDLNVATAGMTEAKKLAFFEGMFGRAAKSALILTGSTQDFDALAGELDNAGGSAARMAATMQDSLAGDFTKTLSALEGVAIAVGEAISKPVRAFLSQFADVLAATTQWIASNQGLVVSIAAVGGVLMIAGAALVAIALPVAAVGMVLSGLATALSVAATAAGVVGTVLAAIVSPAGLAVAAIAAVGAAVLHYSGAGSAALGYLSQAWTALSAEVSSVAGGILAALNSGDMETIGKILSQTLVLYWRAAIGEMSKAWIGFSTSVMNVLDSTFAGILDGSLIQSLAMKMAFAVGTLLDKAIQVFRDALGGLLSFLGVSVDAINEQIGQGIAASLAPDGAPTTAEDRAATRNAEADAAVAQIDAEIAALRAARDASIQGAIDAASQAAGEAAEDATSKATEAAKTAAAGAGAQLQAASLGAGTFSGFALERGIRSTDPVAEAFRTIGGDIVEAVNGVTSAIENNEGIAFDA